MHRWSLRPLGVSGMITSYVVQLFSVSGQRWLDWRVYDDEEDALALRDRNIEDFPDSRWRVVFRAYTLTSETVVE